MTVLWTFLAFIAVAFAARWLIATSSLQKAKQTAGSTHFKGSVLIRLLFGVGIPSFFYGAFSVAISPTFRSDWWVSLILLIFAICGIAYWPEQIVTSTDGISQSRILGLGWRTIPWSGVDYATENPTSGGIEIVPKEGKKIILSPMHAGHDEFLAIAKNHCKMF